MIVYLGADHRGFKLKEALKEKIKNWGYGVSDLGNSVYDKNDDYPDFAKLVADKISQDPASRGILICGSGVGVDVVANKFKNVRSIVGISPRQVFSARNDDDGNVLSLSADFLNEKTAEEMTKTFLETPFQSEERFKRRLKKIAEIEEGEQ